MLDRNGSGGINLDDLTGVMRAMGAQLDDEDILAMFEAVDENGQKSITYEGNNKRLTTTYLNCFMYWPHKEPLDAIPAR